MGLDIRLPIGLMFTLFGFLLIVYGFVSDKAIYQRSLGLNVNLWWGVVLFIFGAVMLVLGRRGTGTAKPADASSEGREMMKETAERDAEGEQ
jgi:protein-S-isoprenylcysteine O-methyltransferase Ste14